MQPTSTHAALAALALAAACHPTPPATAPTPTAQVERLSADYHRQSLSDFPEFGTFLGTGEFDDRLSDNSLEARGARLERLTQMLDEVRALNLKVIPHAQAVTLAMLQTEVEKELATDVCQTPLWDVNPLDGPQVNLLQLQSFQPIPTPERGGKLLSRYRQMPRYLDTHVANLAAGLSRGYRAPKIAVERVISQLDTLLATPDSALALLDPVRTKPEAWPEAEWAAYQAELGGVVRDSVTPAFRRYREFLVTEYLPRAREQVGVSANPNGAECYRARIRAETSLELSPEEVHATGLREMAKIHAEMREITRRRFGTEDLPAVFALLRDDASYAFTTREEVESAANVAVDRVRERLPEVFRLLPKAPVVVKRMEAYAEKDAPAAYYFPPAANGSRPGAYYVNTYQPGSRPRYTAEVLAYHEGVPGHHLQIAIQQELEALPEFRRFAGTTAFVEGWGLYSERLADEMGLYSDDLQRLGMLSFEAWRAGRLVTDAGMHALGWTRAQAIEYMLQNTAVTPLDAVNEIDRYIVWPGQALAYKVGQLEILRLRDEARRRLGERFDLRGFHDVVLGSGAVTLPILRQQVESWISTQEAAQ